MAKVLELQGQRFGKLVAEGIAGKTPAGKFQWACRCDCGRMTLQVGSRLVNGDVKSCGCGRIGNRLRHGHKRAAGGSRAYRSWVNMKLRCSNPKTPNWKDYGGRGITYDPAWEMFDAFLSDMGEPGQGMSLDRIDNDNGYSAANCRWADRVTQRHNRRDALYCVEINGEKIPLVVAVRRYSTVSYMGVWKRIFLLGWPPAEAVTAGPSNRWSRKPRSR